MHTLTARCQSVIVVTVSTLRQRLEKLSNADCSFTIHKVHRDRVSIRADYFHLGKKKHADVLLPAYPTGYSNDAPCNNLNVVLDPVQFEGVESCAERDVFVPLLGHDVLAHYEKMHPDGVLPVSRCC
ncbi:MAG: hypothetical protein WB555_24285 [Candidatus Korobacteraceae bacterium]